MYKTFLSCRAVLLYRSMNRSLALVLTLAFPAFAAAAPSPLRVLFLGDSSPASRDRCHVLMKEMGRKAVWFDYTTDASLIFSGRAKGFDAILNGNTTPLPVDAGDPANGSTIVDVSFPTDPQSLAAAEFLIPKGYLFLLISKKQ